jgi:tRNA A37 methylthiotransferase MiaB
MPSVFIKTYGCQMNERDSEQVARDLQDRGHKLVAHERDADVILLNTCSVREMAEKKAIGKMGMLRKLRREKPKLVLGYMGCMAQRLGEDLQKSSPHVDLVIGTQKFHRVADYVEEALRKREEAFMQEDVRDLGGFILPIIDTASEEGSQNTIRDHLPEKKKEATAFISIMQGCNMHCTFCIVPSTRGEERGRPIAEIVNEARTLVERGIREVTLLGQIVNLYGRHEFPKIGDKSPFVQLIEALHGVDGLDRIRFTQWVFVRISWNASADFLNSWSMSISHFNPAQTEFSRRCIDPILRHRTVSLSPNCDLAVPALRSPRISSWASRVRRRATTRHPGIWPRNLNSTALLFSVTLNEETHRRPSWRNS